ncbi:MAG: hypothetical protein AAF196_18920 [Planctomycetota bacterium]
MGLVVVAVLLHRIASSSSGGSDHRGGWAAAFLVVLSAVGTVLGALWDWSPAVQLLCLGITMLALAQIWAGVPTRTPACVVLAEPLPNSSQWLRHGREAGWELLEEGGRLGAGFREYAEETVDSGRPIFRDNPDSAETAGEFRRSTDRLVTPIPPG